MSLTHCLRRAAGTFGCGLIVVLLAPTVAQARPQLVAAAAHKARSGARPLWVGVPFRARNQERADPAVAPWTASGCADNGYALVDRPDGVGVFELHQGDRPPGAAGGDRCQLSILDPYVIGLPATANPEPRWYRFDVAVPSDHPPISGRVFQTLVEWHGAVAGQAALKLAITSGNRLELTTIEKVLGVDGKPEHWDAHPLAPGRWHRYAIELLTSPDPTIGYFRIYRDGICRTCGDPRADADGRVRRRTARTSATGTVDKNSFTIGYYRDKAITVPTRSLYRNVRIGRTLKDVAPIGMKRSKRACRHHKRTAGHRRRSGRHHKRACRHHKRAHRRH